MYMRVFSQAENATDVVLYVESAYALKPTLWLQKTVKSIL